MASSRAVMAQEVERTARSSVLDRLIDEEPRIGADRPQTWAESLSALKLSVLRDLEWLLNTRRIPELAPDKYPELQRSVYHYGMPDLQSVSGDSEAARRHVLRQLEECIEQFEPRLTSVRVTPAATGTGGGREFRLHIQALLRMEPNPERVSFDTLVDVSSGKVSVSGGSDA
jgi:type VI secretion system protein ImpF